jgi:hypothetical protein
MSLPTAPGRAWRIGGLLATVGLVAGVAIGRWADRSAGATTGGRPRATAVETRAILVATVGRAATATGTAVATPGVAVAGPPALRIAATAVPAEFEFGAATAVSGTLDGPDGLGEPGQSVTLERDQYPFAGYQRIAHATTGAAGSYAFSDLTPDRDTRYEVVDTAEANVVSRSVTVVVNTPVVTHVSTLAHGEITVTSSAVHSRAFDWNDRPVRWYVSRAGSPTSTLAARTLTDEVRAGTTVLKATFYPPSGAFTFRACFTAAGTRGLGEPEAASRCEVNGSAVGHPAAAVPSATEIASAEGFLDGRQGRTGFAVVDSHGQLSGVRLHERFYSASLIKAMLLVAYLRGVGSEHRDLNEDDREVLEPMIHVSDNDAASAVFAVVGETGLAKLARAAGMDDFEPSPAWGLSQISPADQAVFFAEQDSLIPARFVSYARSLLSGIDPSQRWGIPAGVAGRYKVFFKGGWLPDMGIVNQAARLEGDGRTIALSILTSGGRGMGYGEETLEETTQRLLG